jgi:hypothetical protein
MKERLIFCVIPLSEKNKISDTCFGYRMLFCSYPNLFGTAGYSKANHAPTTASNEALQ